MDVRVGEGREGQGELHSLGYFKRRVKVASQSDTARAEAPAANLRSFHGILIDQEPDH